jgi:hypothetical protein
MISLKVVDMEKLRAIQGLEAQGVLDQLLFGLGESGRDKWIRLAQGAFSTSRAAYIAGIQNVAMERPGRAVVELVGVLANMLEQGADAYSLREALLSQPGAKVSASGHRYRVIPFRHATPSGPAGRVGMPMTELYDRPGFASRSGRVGVSDPAGLGRMVYDAAKRLRPGRALPAGMAPLLQPHHATDAFAGMQRQGAAGHRYYTTWRTISDEQSPSSWAHPGLEARHLVDHVAEHITKIAPAAIAALVRGATGGAPRAGRGGAT